MLPSGYTPVPGSRLGISSIPYEVCQLADDHRGLSCTSAGQHKGDVLVSGNGLSLLPGQTSIQGVPCGLLNHRDLSIEEPAIGRFAHLFERLRVAELIESPKLVLSLGIQPIPDEAAALVDSRHEVRMACVGLGAPHVRFTSEQLVKIRGQAREHGPHCQLTLICEVTKAFAVIDGQLSFQVDDGVLDATLSPYCQSVFKKGTSNGNGIYGIDL